VLQYASIQWLLHFSPSFVEHLHHKISTLTSRIKQLEDALLTLQANQSTELHPSLALEYVSSEGKSNTDDDSKMRDETIGGKKGGRREASSSGSNIGEIIHPFGTLSIPQLGVSEFFGPTGGSEVREVFYLFSSLLIRYRFHRVSYCRTKNAQTSTSSCLRHRPSLLHPLKDVLLTPALLICLQPVVQQASVTSLSYRCLSHSLHSVNRLTFKTCPRVWLTY
jgi:hypothetical protein